MDQTVESGDIDGEQERQSDGDGIGYDRTGCRMDGTTSGKSKRLDTRPLAETDSSQHEQRERCERGTAHVPEPSTPPPDHHRRPMDHLNVEYSVCHYIISRKVNVPVEYSVCH